MPLKLALVLLDDDDSPKSREERRILSCRLRTTCLGVGADMLHSPIDYRT